MTEPIPPGTDVEYRDCPGERYVVTAHADPYSLFSGTELAQITAEGKSLTDFYPDGVAYEIWKEGVLRKNGNRMYMYYRVRRGSLSVIEGEEHANPDDQD